MAWSVFNFSESSSVTVPGHSPGDLIMIVAGRGNSGDLPSIPPGWNVANARSFNVTTKSVLCAWKLAQTAGEVSGTWTGANLLSCGVFSGDSVCVLAGPNNNANGAANTSVNYPVVNPQSATLGAPATRMASPSSFVIGVVYAKQINSGINAPPSGMSLLANGQGVSANQIAVHQTNVLVSSFGATNVFVSSSIDWITLMIELIDTGFVNPSSDFFRPHLVSPFLIGGTL